MARQIIRQPDGRYAIWSTTVDNFVYLNCTKEELVEAFLEKERKETIRKVNEIVEKLREDKEKPYYQFTVAWEEALRTIKECHGRGEVKKIEKYLER